MTGVFRSKLFQRTSGIALLCVAAVTICGWFFWLVPVIRRNDPIWQEQFTRKAYWREVQTHIHRYGWTHDDFDPVGRYGDKGWAEWIIHQAEAGQQIADCGRIGHKDTALKFITCTDPAPGTHLNTETQWLNWWSANKHKSQPDWVQAGLLRYGVSAHLPPSEMDIEPLLVLLGRKSTNATEQVPEFVKYNAFRWLREAGFEAIPFAISNATAQTSTAVRAGIIEYGKYDRTWPKDDGVGRFEMASSPPELHERYRPYFYSLAVQIGAYSFMTVSLVAGTVLLVHSFRHRKSS